jgi:trimethylamine--corrinoid protein Co-methyltransferase
MQRDYYYPKIGDRKTPAVWEEEGKMTMEENALKQAKLILKTNNPSYIDNEVDKIIRSKFNIILNA